MARNQTHRDERRHGKHVDTSDVLLRLLLVHDAKFARKIICHAANRDDFSARRKSRRPNSSASSFPPFCDANADITPVTCNHRLSAWAVSTRLVRGRRRRGRQRRRHRQRTRVLETRKKRRRTKKRKERKIKKRASLRLGKSSTVKQS